MENPASVLIIGGDSEIGAATAGRLLENGVSVTTTTRDRAAAGPDRLLLDLSTPPETWPVLPAHRACLIAVGETSTEACRRDPTGTAAVNVDLTVRLATGLVERGCYVLFLSTNQVFDGSMPHRDAGDPPCPIIEYGRQKAAAELRLSELAPRCGVLRLTKVLGRRSPRFVEWKRDLAAGRAVTAFHDMVIAPVSLDLVAGVVVWMLGGEVGGIVQASGNEDISHAAIAEAITERMGADPGLVRRVSVRDAGLAEPVPRYTTLDTSRLEDLFGIAKPSSMDVVCAIVAEP